MSVRVIERVVVERRRPSNGRTRMVVVAALFALWCAGIGWRLVHLQVDQHDALTQRALRQQQREDTIHAPRGTIYDARGRELAVSVPAWSLYAEPARIDDASATATALARVLGLDRSQLEQRLRSDRSFTFLARKLEPARAEPVRALALPGIGLLKETRRDYPFGPLAATVLGFVGTDHEGLAGLEAAYERVVAGTAARRRLLRDARQKGLVAPAALETEATPGADLHLTIDASLQFVAERALARAVAKWGAKGGTVVVLDPRDSAVLAMASTPSFDPNHFADVPSERWRNPAVSDAYEPGSTFKMVTAAAALDSLAVHPDDVFDCGMGAITLASTEIRDHKPFGYLTFREVIAKSSNVGVIKASLRVGHERLYRATTAFGFGRPTGIDLPGESDGIVHPVERWQGLASAYAAFGHGLSLTPLQLANAYAALVNGGELHRPYVVRAIGRDGQLEPIDQPRPERLPFTGATRRELMRLLEGVVENGTGKEAAIAGYRVGGKTGTAEKSNRQGYSKTGRLASFVGFAPARQPRLVAVVMIDEPSGATGGGVVAAPVFREVVSEALLYLGIRPGLDDDLLLAATERPPGPRFLRVPPSSTAPTDSPHRPLTVIADAAASPAPPRGALGGQP